MFVVGTNDCPQEIWAITIAFATPLFAFVLAIWQRVIAGTWLIFAGCYFTYGMVAERNYMIHVRNFPDQPSVRETIVSSLNISLILIGFGMFWVVTGLLRWPGSSAGTLQAPARMTLRTFR
jgi:hypothetical protein